MKNSNNNKVVSLKKFFSSWKQEGLDNHGFFVIFNGFLEENILQKISGGAMKLYIFLGLKSDNKTGESFYKISTISDYFKVSDRTVSNWFSELEKLNLIIRYQLKFNSVSHTYLNSYKLGKKRNKKI
ncbi:MAG: helix-turn-helix domain-containing protein [Luteococcus japonicus]